VIRILLVDDHASFRQSLALLLEREPDLTVVGQAGTLAEARRMLHGVDVAVIEVDDLPDGNGTQLIKQLHRVSPDSQVLGLVLPRCGGRVHAAQALEAGAACMLQKSVGIGDIISAIRGLHAGRGRLA
jgi:DNA-binding NarL/FixJ family response regulator